MFKSFLDSEKARKTPSRECTYIYDQHIRVVWDGKKCISAVQKKKNHLN